MKADAIDLKKLLGPGANDNAGTTDEPPSVRTPKGRPASVYAQQGNVLLPLRFARRMAGWNRQDRN
ncbi:MAG TPA: hypothetical protein VH374_06835 [Polyangia bacterium]|jgi:hypothetical protein|nr:hypothetical protein [Polyangia bacterium]